jgi:hypothetical protein
MHLLSDVFLLTSLWWFSSWTSAGAQKRKRIARYRFIAPAPGPKTKIAHQKTRFRFPKYALFSCFVLLRKKMGQQWPSAFAIFHDQRSDFLRHTHHGAQKSLPEETFSIQVLFVRQCHK